MALDLSKKIGKGGYGDVWKVNVDISVPNEMACNITSIRPFATHMDDALKGSKKLSQLNHTNIVQLFFILRFAESIRRSFVCLSMELCDGDFKTNIESSQRLTEKRDIYSLGVTLAESLTGIDEKNLNSQRFIKLLNAAKFWTNRTFHNWEINFEVSDLLTKMTYTKPYLRPNIQEVHSHPFVVNRPEV